jgi:hypothetical protein
LIVVVDDESESLKRHLGYCILVDGKQDARAWLAKWFDKKNSHKPGLVVSLGK